MALYSFFKIVGATSIRLTIGTFEDVDVVHGEQIPPSLRLCWSKTDKSLLRDPLKRTLSAVARFGERRRRRWDSNPQDSYESAV